MGNARTATAAAKPTRWNEPLKKELTGEYYVFIAENLISPRVLAANPAWDGGGALRPNAMTLSYCNGFVRRCEITPLVEHYASEQKSNFQPETQKNLTGAYYAHDGNEKVLRGMIMTPEGPVPDGLLRVPFHPSREINYLTGQRDGLVRMPVNNDEEMDAAQYILFPEWDGVKSGMIHLPDRLQKLKAYFKSNLAKQSDPFAVKVLKAAVLSCEQLEVWGNDVIAKSNSELAKAEKKGNDYAYGDDALRAFEFLGIPRRDIAAQEQSGQISTLIDATTKTAESVNRFIDNQPSGNPLPQPAAAGIDPDRFAAFQRWEVEQKKTKEQQPATVIDAGEGTKEEAVIEPEIFEAKTPVLVDGKKALIVKKVFGANFRKYQVVYEDDSQDTVDAEQVTKA